MTCEQFINPLDLECLFVNTLAGSYEIFAIIALLVLIFVSAKFRMTNISLGFGVLLFAVIFTTALPFIAYLIIFFGSVIIFYAIGNVIKR